MSLRVLVTGGLGFIGGHLVEHILQQSPDAQMHIVDITQPWSVCDQEAMCASWPRDRVRHWYRVNVCLAAELSDCIAEVKPTHVIHLAGLCKTVESFDRAAHYVDVNIHGTLNLLECCRNQPQIEKIVLGSSGVVYGECQLYAAQEERMLFDCSSPYAATCVGAEMIARPYKYSGHLPLVIARLFSIYGPRSHSSVISKLTDCFMQPGTSFPLYGQGQAERDFLHVRDAVSALWLLATSGRAIHDVYNVGSGTAVPITALMDYLPRYVGRENSYTSEANRPGELQRSLADVHRLRASVGWKPTVALHDGLKEYVEWVKAGKSVVQTEPSSANI